MIVIKGIDWDEFKELLDITYIYFDKRHYITSLSLLDEIYSRYQKGERTVQLYKEFMDMIGD